MLRGKKWLKEFKETVADLDKVYKQAKYAVLLLADIGNKTIAGFNFVPGGFKEAIVERYSQLWPALFVQKPIAEKCALFYLEPPVAEAVLLNWGYAQELLIEMAYHVSNAKSFSVYRIEMTEDETIFVSNREREEANARLRRQRLHRRHD